MYEPISVEIYSAYGDGTYRSHNIEFTELLVGLIENGYSTMRLHERVNN
jgi:hypothetical protein